MGPFLFNILINDLKKVMEHTVSNTADSTELEAVMMFNGRPAIQRVLARLEKEDNRDHMKLNKDKCQVLPLGWSF